MRGSLSAHECHAPAQPSLLNERPQCRILHLGEYLALTSGFAATCLKPLTEAPPAVDLAALGHAVARARQAVDLTLKGLAERGGVSRRMLVEIEQGQANSSIGVLHSIAHAVGLTLGELAQAACTDEPTIDSTWTPATAKDNRAATTVI
ncbi:helix-turn-helix domain-containing protein [Plantactinospora sp. DSM 117369]